MTILLLALAILAPPIGGLVVTLSLYGEVSHKAAERLGIAVALMGWVVAVGMWI
jgi:hypothetical protein